MEYDQNFFKNIEIFQKLITKETPLIGIEPSAILTFRDEYHRLVSDKNKLAQIKEQELIQQEENSFSVLTLKFFKPV
mgnify:CR=1 FL=1